MLKYYFFIQWNFDYLNQLLVISTTKMATHLSSCVVIYRVIVAFWCQMTGTGTRLPQVIIWIDFYLSSVRCNDVHPKEILHYDDVMMNTIASQITSLTIVYSIVYSDADQRNHQSSTSLAFVWGIHRGPVNSPHKWPVTRKMFPFDDDIMSRYTLAINQ